jgi:hypothetical protein
MRLRKDGTPYAPRRPCAHDPRNPRLDLVHGPHDRMPEPIVDGCERMREFYRKPQLLPSLNKRLKKDGRERRSERRESLALMGQELLMHTDRKTWRIGNYGGEVDGGRAVLSYAQNMQVHLRRAQRAIEHFTAAGYLAHVFDKKGRAVASITDYAGRRYLGQKRIEKGDDYEGLPAEREWTAKGLDELGILGVLKPERDAHRRAARAAAEEAAALSAAAQRQRADDQQREYRRRAHIRQAPKAPALPEEDVKGELELTRAIYEAARAAGQPIGLAEARTEARRRRGTGPPE